VLCPHRLLQPHLLASLQRARYKYTHPILIYYLSSWYQPIQAYQSFIYSPLNLSNWSVICILPFFFLIHHPLLLLSIMNLVAQFLIYEGGREYYWSRGHRFHWKWYLESFHHIQTNPCNFLQLLGDGSESDSTSSLSSLWINQEFWDWVIFQILSYCCYPFSLWFGPNWSLYL